VPKYVYNTFGNDAPNKIMGKGTFGMDNGRGKAKNFLFGDGFKHNLLSVSEIFD